MTAIVTSEFSPSAPCPPYCNLKPGHPVDSIADGDRALRGHGGPRFGPYLSAGADEYVGEPGVLHVVVQLYTDDPVNISDPEVLRRLADDAEAAAVWLEANR